MGSKFILVTGGAGFIGSHTAVDLINFGFIPVVIDDLSNSTKFSLAQVEKITGVSIPFFEADICLTDKLREIFKSYSINSVIHFAGLKSVSESITKPNDYYNVNLAGTLNLLRVMDEFGVKNFVFSSSATVYGNPISLPISENHPVSEATNPYGTSKLFVEKVLNDLYHSDPSWHITILRYFNPVGAHQSGIIGENPTGVPANLMPLIVRAASGEIPNLFVYGSDYETKDGTGVRDYIHVMDLARAHVDALINKNESPGVYKFNVGTGHGYSVLEIINTFSTCNDVSVPYKIVGRRDGDVAACYSDPTLIKSTLGWSAKYTLEDMCRDSWRWHLSNLSRS